MIAHTAGTRIYPPDMWPTVCGTGHRALTGDQEQWLRGKLADGLRWLHADRGTTTVIVGMARGFDLLLAETVLGLGGFRLAAYIPFLEQTVTWGKTIAGRADIRRWEQVRAAADPALEKVVGEIPADLAGRRRAAVVARLMYDRNCAMLDDADGLVAGWDGHKFDGGSHHTVLEAVRRGMFGVHLDPAARTVRHLTRDVDDVTRAGVYHRDCGCVAQVTSLSTGRWVVGRLAAAGHDQWRVRKLPARTEWVERCGRCADDPSRELAVAAP